MPIRYRILSASFTTHSKGSEPGGKCASLGGTSGWVTLKGGSAGVVQDQEYSTLDTRWSGGVLSGQIFAKAATTISDGASGCEYDSNWQLQPCSWTSNDFALPNPFAVGFSVRVPDPASGEAIVHWQVHSPGIGDTATVKCDVAIYHHVPYDTTTRKVPLAQLLSSEPQTYSYGDSIHFDQDDQGHAASIDYDWTYTLTVQRY